MKLIKLKLLSPFRSIQKDFELFFREKDALEFDKLNQFHPYCFVGFNGSGKSNVLEALSLIFFYLECSFSKYLPVDFKKVFDKNPLSFYFELEYLLYQSENNITHISIKYDNNQLEFYRIVEGKGIPINTVPKREGDIKEDAIAKRYLPELIVGYSSGENEILSLPFLKTKLMHYDNYKQALLQEEKYYNKPLTGLVYIDYGMSQAVLLANFLMQTEDVLLPIKNILKIEKLHSFRLCIKNFIIKNEEIGNSETEGKELLSQIKYSIIDKLRKCSTSEFSPDEDTTILDFYINDVTREAFNVYFKTPFELFLAFQTLIELNSHIVENSTKREIYTKDSMYILEKMPKSKGENLVFYFNNFFIKKEGIESLMLIKNLSDGEHQLLHSIGICLMLKNKNSLLLLDEPETHFNPDWRSKFINLLNECLEKGGSDSLKRDIIITSHSPLIVSDCFPDKVIVFEKGKQPINAKKMKFNTFGTSYNIVLENIFKKDGSIPNYSNLKLNEIKNREFLTLEDVQNAKEDARLLGESSEKVFLFRDLILKEKELKENAKNI